MMKVRERKKKMRGKFLRGPNRFPLLVQRKPELMLKKKLSWEKKISLITVLEEREPASGVITWKGGTTVKSS